jgi:hypothetical protein
LEALFFSTNDRLTKWSRDTGFSSAKVGFSTGPWHWATLLGAGIGCSGGARLCGSLRFSLGGP